jgi:transcriptional regulator with XRE-family HTH domain
MKELEELGERVRRHRIALGIKQKDLAGKAAVSLDVISSLENGRSVGTISLARVLRGLGLRDALADMLPAPAVSPLDLQKLAGKQRQRVR